MPAGGKFKFCFGELSRIFFFLNIFHVDTEGHGQVVKYCNCLSCSKYGGSLGSNLVFLLEVLPFLSSRDASFDNRLRLMQANVHEWAWRGNVS